MLMVLLAGVGQAATYEWVDAGGVVHFTDDPGNIPEKYRDKAKKQENGIQNIISEPAAPPAAATITDGMKEGANAGHDQQWWRSRYAELRNEIKGVREGVPKKKEKLGDLRRKRVIFQRGSDRVAYNDLAKEIAADEARLLELEEQLAALDQQAAKAGVPLEWRQ
jgi:hypothetical protein